MAAREMIAFGTSLVLACVILCNGLWCYEADDYGKIEARKNSKHSPLCVLSSNGRNYNVTTPFGTNNDIEDVRAYRQLLARGRMSSSAPSYSVLTACVVERYYVSSTLVDYTFRCFCDDDYCNKKTDMISYLKSAIENDSQSLQRRMRKRL